MSTTFQSGDRVRCVDSSRTDLVRGRIYVIVPYQISVDSAGLSDPTLVYVRREGRAEGYYPERFRLVEVPKPLARRAFRAGDRVRCVKDRGCCWLREGESYTIEEVTMRGLLRLRGRPHHDGYLPTRFKRVVAPAPFTPYHGTMDEEYGPAAPAPPAPTTAGRQNSGAPAFPVHPIHRAIQQRFPTHPADVVIALDELRRH